MVARAGILVLIAVDTAMTGHAGTEELAAYAVASAPLVPMLLLGVGLLSATTVFIAHAVAFGKIPNPISILKRLFRFGLPMGIAHTLESSAFATMVIFAGWMGTTVVTAYQAAFNLIGSALLSWQPRRRSHPVIPMIQSF